MTQLHQNCVRAKIARRMTRFAKECLELARAATDERSKATLLQMAQVWNWLADQQDRKVNGEVAH